MMAAQSPYPPAAPGPDAAPWRCRCGNLLGIVDRAWLVSRHRGRAIEARLPVRVQCEACGRKQWIPAPPTRTDVVEHIGPQTPR